MKKIIFSLMLLLGMGLAANAQTKVSWDGPLGVNWKFKRCFVQNETCVIDLTIENAYSKDIQIQLGLFPDHWTNGGTQIFDDEGNVYTYKQIGGTFGGKDLSGYGMYSVVSILKGTVVKLRLQVTEMDEYASVIKTLRLPMSIQGIQTAELRVSNIPIMREE